MIKLLVLLSSMALAVSAQVQSSTGSYNISSPTINAPYVASRVLPCIYTVASTVNSDNFQLSISLSNGVNTTVIDPVADISQGYSFQRNIGGRIVYEHQFNYLIPVNITAGSYHVVFTEHVSQTNLTIPILIRSAPLASSSIVSSSASATILHVQSSSSITPTRSNSAGLALDFSKYLFLITFLVITIF